MEVQEWEEQLLFLHRISEGPADRSYGIQVARLAGLPSAVIQKARAIMAAMPEAHLDGASGVRHQASGPIQQPLFLESEADPLRMDLDALNLNEMTPMEALVWLSLKQKQGR